MSCVGQGYLTVSDTWFPVDTEIHAYHQEPIQVRLHDRRGGPLLFAVECMFTMYEYRLLDRRERELLVYHWQPGPSYAGPDHPHLHVSASLNAATSAIDQRQIDLDKLHLPAGRVTLTAVVRSLITEFEVEPLRSDWMRVLDEAEAAERDAASPPR